NADLYQNYLNGAPATVTLLATPARWKDRLNANLAIYGQDAWTLGRITITYGLRWEYVSEQVSGQPAQQGRFANIPAFGDIHLPIWRTFSPRTAVVYDLFGNGKTAIRFGFNKFEAAAATNLAALYDPANAATVTYSPTWTDLNKDDVAQGELGCVYLTPGCEINFAQLPANFGQTPAGCTTIYHPGNIACGNTQVDANIKRDYSVNYSVGVQHAVTPALSVSANWYHVDFYNIQTDL